MMKLFWLTYGNRACREKLGRGQIQYASYYYSTAHPICFQPHEETQYNSCEIQSPYNSL